MTTNAELLSEAQNIAATELRKQECQALLADVAAARAAGATALDIRKALELLYGEVYNTDELPRFFDPLSFAAPYIVVCRKKDRVRGTLKFLHQPRLYFSFEPEGTER